MSGIAARRGMTACTGRARFVAVALVLSVATVRAQPADVIELTVPIAAIHAGTLVGEAVLGSRTVHRSTVQNISTLATRGTAVGKIARRTLVPGQPIPLDALRAPPVVTGGQGIRIVYQSGGLRITGEGIAQHAAGLGEALAVRSAQSGTLLRGRVTSPRDVLVEDEP